LLGFLSSKGEGFPHPGITPMLGAFSKATGIVRIESVLSVILKEWEGELAELNAKAARIAYEKTVVMSP